MAWRILLQPNGKYARFSEVVDDIVEYDMSMEQALECCVSQRLGQRDAANKVQRALFAGNARFLEALGIIARVHGRTRMRHRAKLMGGSREHYPPVRRRVEALS
jgi:hypothetical protein